MNTMQRAINMKKMRSSGKTLQQIGDYYGITRERARQILAALNGDKRYRAAEPTKKKCVCGVSFIANGTTWFCEGCRPMLEGLSGRDRARYMVRIRDKFTCQACGKKWNKGERQFDVHHLDGLCGKKSRGYDATNEIDRLITYCHKCHLGNHVTTEQFSKRLTDEQIKACHILRKSGLSYNKIGELLGTTGMSVRYNVLKITKKYSQRIKV